MAKVLTGISGNLISAASAGFAPTNSADVSAIASAYQVVSATGTQLYAGTAYVTSVNDNPLSASRAGNAANASLANSAWYDGTGRLISSLPDSAAVSAIASSYAESAASSKQDELTFSYDDDKISAINGSALAGQGGGGEQVVTSLQYAVSESTSTYELYQPAGTTGSYMSSNLLAINDPEYGMGQYDMSSLSSFDVFMTGMDSNFVYDSATMSAMIVKASASGIQPWVWSPSDTAFCGFLVSVQTGTIGYDQTGSARVSAAGLQHYGSSWPDGTPFYIQPPLIFFTNRVDPVYNGTARIGTAYGSASYVNTAIGGESSVSGVNELPIYVEKDTSVSAIAEAYAKSAVSSVSGNYYPRYSNPLNYVQSANVVMRSSIGSSDNFITSISGTPLMATDSALTTSVSDTASATAYQTAFVNFEPDSVSRSVIVRLPNNSTTYITALDSNGYNIDAGSISLALDPDNYVYTGQYNVTSTAAVSARVFSYYALSASAICGYTVPLAHASALPTYSYDAEDKISAINGSAIAGGGGGGGGLVTAIGSLDGHVTSINSTDIVGRPSAVMTRSADENTLQANEWMSMGSERIEGRSFSYSLGINKVYLVPNHTSNNMSATAYDNDYNLVGVVPLTATSCTISSDTAIITRVDAQSDENGLSMYVSGFKYTPSGDYIVALPSTESCVLKSDMSVALGHDLTAASGDYGLAFVQGHDASAGNGGFAFGYMASAEYGVAFGTSVVGKGSSIANGYSVSSRENSIANGYYATADNNGLAVGGNISALNRSFANGTNVSAVDLSLAQGQSVSATWTSMAQGYGVTASSNSFARGVFVSAINSSTVLGQNNLSGDGSGSTGAAFVLGDGTSPNARHDLMVVTKDGEITMYSGTADTTGTGIMSSIRALSANAGGVDSATVSAIASSYAESAVSGKADSSALSSYVPYSSLEYNTASAISGINGSALAAGSTYSAGEGIDITDDVISVETPVDIVAGPGIVVDNPDGNTLRVSMAQDYEVTLWSGSCLRQSSAAVSLSESASNFEKIEIYALPNPSDSFNSPQVFTYPGSNTAGAYLCPFMTTGLKGKFSCGLWTITNGTSFNLIAAGQTDNYPTLNWDNSYGGVVKVVGIHRIANN